MSKVRIINDETGDVKFVSSYVAGQSDQLAQYGYRVEDLNISKPKAIIKLDEVGELESEEKDLFKDEESLQETVIERKKPGPKPKVKEVTETE